MNVSRVKWFSENVVFIIGGKFWDTLKELTSEGI